MREVLVACVLLHRRYYGEMSLPPHDEAARGATARVRGFSGGMVETREATSIVVTNGNALRYWTA